MIEDRKKFENIKEEALYTIREVSELFGITRIGVQKWIEKGKIKKSMIGGRVYIRGDELTKLIKL